MRLEDATILLVDDLLTLRELFSVWLSRSGCAVITVQDGVEAIRLLTTQRVDAVLSDIGMPVMDGITLAGRIRDLQFTTPILLFSGYALDDQQLAYLKTLGIDQVLTKPLNRPALVQALEHALMTVSERAPLVR